MLVLEPVRILSAARGRYRAQTAPLFLGYRFGVWTGFVLACQALLSSPATANGLQASPVLIEMSDAKPTSAITIQNTSNAAFDVQTRVFRWTQENGIEKLEEAEDVVTSPPMTSLKPGTNYAIRVVRINKTPIAAEESYRVFVDQLPNQQNARSGIVQLVTRHSIPVFLSAPSAGEPVVAYRLVQGNKGQVLLEATNSGTRRVRISAASLTFPDGRKLALGQGLLGYVLAGSTMRFPIPKGEIKPGQAALLNAASDTGPLKANVAALR